MMTMHTTTPRIRSTLYYLIAAAVLAIAVVALQTYGQESPQVSVQPEPTGVELIQRDAVALAPTLKSELAKKYVGAAKDLPRIQPRTLYRNKTTRAWLTKADADKLTDEERKDVVERPLDESFYYNTGYGSPLAYSRPLEILAEAGVNDVKDFRTLDFGCGGVAPVRMLASLGIDAVGVDVEPLFPLYYNQPGDQGEIETTNGKGKITLVTGRWPAEDAAKAAVGGGYDLIISKNTLKRGYIHPERQVDKRMLVDLGVDDAAYVKALFDALKPGGRMMIYNICPHPSKPDEDYKPWSDGRCPFSKELLEAAGFRIAAFDVDDGPACRAMAKVLGWDKGQGAMSLEEDLFAHYTLMEKPGSVKTAP